MAGGIGAQGHLGIRKESSFASGGSVDNWQPVINASVNLAYKNVYTDQVRNTPEQVGGQQANRAVTGSIAFPVTPQNASQWWVCGVGQASSPYKPTRTLSSMLFQLDQEQECVQASGCMIGTVAFSSTQGEILTCSVDYEAKDMADVTAGTPSYTASDNPYLHSEAVVKLNGSTVTNVTAFTITINNNLVTDLYGTGYTRVDIPAGKAQITGSFTKLFNDSAEYNAFLAASARSFQITFSRGTRSFDINCAKIRYDTRPSEVTGQSDYIMETFSFTAYVDDPASEQSVALTIAT